MARKIGFGVTLQNYFTREETVPLRGLLDLAVRAEGLGFDSVWVWDHIVLGSKTVFPVYDSLTVLTAVAALTNRVRLATGILVLSLRNPVLLAKQVATLDNLSGGRVNLGVAAGWYEREFRACGVDFTTRGRILKTSVEILKRLWTEDDVTGNYGPYQFNRVTVEPKPVQKPHPPIWMGGYIDRVLKRVGGVADGWISYFYTADSFRRTWGKILEYAALAGRDGAKMGNCDIIPVHLTTDKEKGSGIAKSFVSKYCDMPAWSEASMESAIVGPRKECIDRIEPYLQAGVQNLVMMPTVSRLSEIPQQVEAFGKEIIPSF